MAKILWLILFAYVVALTVAMVEKYNEEKSIKFLKFNLLLFYF